MVNDDASTKWAIMPQLEIICARNMNACLWLVNKEGYKITLYNLIATI